jgi:hypothetical protein
MFTVLSVLLIISSYYLLSTVPTLGYCVIALVVMNVTMSISIGLYHKLDLWTVNKLHYIDLSPPPPKPSKFHCQNCSHGSPTAVPSGYTEPSASSTKHSSKLTIKRSCFQYVNLLDDPPHSHLHVPHHLAPCVGHLHHG